MTHRNLKPVLAAVTVLLLLMPASSAAVLPAGTLSPITGDVTGAVCIGEYHYGDASALMQAADQRTHPVLIVVAVVAVILLSSDLEQEPDVIWSYECDVTNMDLRVTGGESTLRRVILEHRPDTGSAYKEVDSCEYDGVLVAGCTADGGTKTRTPAGGESGVNGRPKKVDVCIDPDVRAINAPQEDAVPSTVSPSARKFFSGPACKTVTISWTEAPNLSQFLQGRQAREDRLNQLALGVLPDDTDATVVGPVGVDGGGESDGDVVCTLLDNGCAGAIVAAVSATVSADAGARLLGVPVANAKVEASFSFASAGGVTVSAGQASHSDIVVKTTVGDRQTSPTPKTCTTTLTSGTRVCGPRLALQTLDENRCATAESDAFIAVTGMSANVALEAHSSTCDEEATRVLNQEFRQPLEHVGTISRGDILRVRLSDIQGDLHEQLLADLVALQEQIVLEATADWDRSNSLVADMRGALLTDAERAVLQADPVFDVEVVEV